MVTDNMSSMKKSTPKLRTATGKVCISFNIDLKIFEQIEEDKKKKGLRRSDWLSIAALYYLQKDSKNNENNK